MHRRLAPTVHEFAPPVSMIWIDPDHPDELFGRSRLWSHRHPAPVRFKPGDYGTDGRGPAAEAVRAELAEALGHRPTGPVRMLTQPRRWGWLFNPITAYFAWDDADDEPVGVVAEVTNTPWKERHRYAVPLNPDGTGWLRATFAKALHVSPFLDEAFAYHASVGPAGIGPEVRFDLDVVRPGTADPVVQTRLDVTRREPTPEALRAFLAGNPLATHRVSAGIHAQAARLLAKRVPFVPHPRRRESEQMPT